MKWLRKLYFGKKAKKQKNFLLRTIENRQALLYLYLLVLSERGPKSKKELVLYHSFAFMQNKISHDGTIVGIALGKLEGHQLIHRILREALEKTKGYDMVAYLEAIGSLE